MILWRKNDMRNKNLLFRVLTASLFFAYCFMLFVPGGKSERVSAATTPDWVEAKAECVMELNSRRVLYESHGDLRLPMASTTKILTAITVLENVEQLKTKIEIPPDAAGIEGSSVYLKAGDVYTIEELLYGLMLRSGNDCATALALYCGGNIETFSSLMNRTAQKAGALQSRFKNPHGLPCDGHYTTAHDLGLITGYAMENPIFRTIVSTKYYQPRGWQNKNKMLQIYEGGIGVKTGYTKQAGRCLVSAAERDGMTLVCVVLNCPTTYERSAKLLDDAFDSYRNVKVLGAKTPLTVTEGNKELQGKTKQDIYYPLLKEEEDLIEIRTKSIKNIIKTEKTKEIIGQFEIYLAKRLLFSGNLYKL